MDRFNLMWVVNLFGTAVGAGILFLPISAGIAGFWPLVLMTLIVGPMTYYAHRALSYFVLGSSKRGADITEVVEEYFGKAGGFIITLLYLAVIFPILLIYGNSITNTTLSFMENQAHIENPSRVATSLVLILLLVGVMLFKQKTMLKIANVLVYPLAIFLFIMSIYLIPKWHFDAIYQVPNFKGFIGALWYAIPTLVFSFSHFAAISSFTVAQQNERKDFASAEENIKKTSLATANVLLFFIMFFVFSCVLALSPQDLELARSENVTILTYLANKFDSPWISYFGPIIAFLAIATSFFGHYLGASEGIRAIVKKIAGKDLFGRRMEVYIAIFFILTLWGVATINPSILGIIVSIGGPITALILFILPMYGIAKVPSLARYKKYKVSNAFTTILGLVAVSGVVYQLFN